MCQTKKIRSLCRLTALPSFEDQSLSSTVCVEDLKQPCAKDYIRPTRRVCIREDLNIEYASRVKKESLRKLWYKNSEMKEIRQNLASDIESLRQRVKGEHAHWYRSFVVAYQSLSASSSVEDIQLTLETCKYLIIDPDLLGMEKWVLGPVTDNKAKLRKHLVHEICLQVYPNRNLRKVSRELSRPARLFAHYTAMMSASALQD